MKAIKRSIISITASGIGSYADWRIELELRELKKGYSVWVLEDNYAEERIHWKKIDGSSHALSWREACRYLMEDSRDWVTTDKYQDVSVYGVPKWTVFLFKFIYISDIDNPAYKFHDIARVILGFNDEDIQEASKYLSNYDPYSADETACNIMEALDQVVTDLGKDGLSKYNSLKQLYEAYELPKITKLVEFSQKLLYVDEEEEEEYEKDFFQEPSYRDIVIRGVKNVEMELQILRD